MDLIEKLKHNKTAFGLLEPEERECFEEVGIKNCVCLAKHSWWGSYTSVAQFNPRFIYRIKPDYQPELEKCEVNPETLTYERVGCHRKKLYEAFSDPDFSDFLDEWDNPIPIRGRMDNYGNNKGKSAPIPKYVLFVKRSIDK